jgi:hypothetical protein
MEAARISAMRGHDVVLFDQRDVLGGRMNVAKLPAGRSEWGRMIAHKSAEISRLGVTLRLGAMADGAAILAEQPDVVLLACGSRPGPVPVRGAEGAPLVIVDDAASNPDLCGERVLVIDNINRTPAMATAVYLAKLGRRVDMSTQGFYAGHSLVIQNLTFFWREAALHGVTFLPAMKPVAFEGGNVTFEHVFSRETLPPRQYDTIVWADPGLPRDDLLADLAGQVAEVRAIGDAYAPRDIEAAFLDGYEAAITI